MYSYIYIIYSKIYRLKNNTIYTLVHTYQRSTIVRGGCEVLTPLPFLPDQEEFFTSSHSAWEDLQKRISQKTPEEKDPV